MTESVALSRRPIAAFALLALAAISLSACGPSRDEALSAKVARAEQAANKAEEAAAKAERAARAAGARLNDVNAARDDSQGPVPVGDERGPDEPIDTANASAAHNTDLASALNAPAR